MANYSLVYSILGIIYCLTPFIAPLFLFYIYVLRAKYASHRRNVALTVVFLALVPMLLLIFYGYSFSIWPQFERPFVQAALDEQCGVGVVNAYDGRISYDPSHTWRSPAAYCIDDSEDGWVCECH